MKKEAIIKIPDGIDGMDVQTNHVHPIVIVNALEMLQKHFARVLVSMAEVAVGKNAKAQERWLDEQTKKYLGDNPGDFKFGQSLN